MTYDYSREYEARRNKNVPVKKDFDRILDIYKFSKDRIADERKMAHLIKDKNKAVRRGLATMLLRGKIEPDQLEKKWLTAYTGSFFDKAKRLGATEAEAQEALADAVFLEDYKKYVQEYREFEDNVSYELVEKDGEEVETVSSGRWLNVLNKKLSQENIPFKYENSESNILDRYNVAKKNGKHAERTTLLIWPKEKECLKIGIEIIVDEKGGSSIFDVISCNSSSLNIPRNETGYINLNKLFAAIKEYRACFDNLSN